MSQLRRINPLIPRFWEQATRLQSLDETVAAIGRIVADRFPLEGLFVRRIDRARRSLRMLAEYRPRESPCPEGHVDSSEGGQWLESLESWCAAGEVEIIDPADSDYPFADAVAPDDRQAPFLLGPLGITKDRQRLDAPGVVTLAADPDYRLTEADKPWLEAILGPLNVAIQNDARLQEARLPNARRPSPSAAR